MNPLTTAFHFDHDIANQIAGQLPVLPGYPELFGGKKKKRSRSNKKKGRKGRGKKKTVRRKKTKTKSRNRTKTKTKTKTKSRTKTKTKTKTKSRRKSRTKNGGAPPLIAAGISRAATLIPFLGSGESK